MMTQSHPNAPGAHLVWRIGKKSLTTLSDGYNKNTYDILHSIPPEKGRELQRRAFRTDDPIFTHNMFLIRGEDHAPILIDAGMGIGFGPTLGWLPRSLEMAGVRPEDIGLVLMTHLHPDHCFGLVDDARRPVYPNAEILLHKDEKAFWFSTEAEQGAPDSLKPFFGMVRASVEPYKDRMRLFDGGQVAPGVTAVPLPGHTPGHTGFLLASEGEEIFIWADIVHAPAIQPAWPDAGVIHDVDPAASAATRRRIFAEVAERRQRVAGCHLEFPGLAYLERAGDAYRLVPELWASHA